MKYEAVFGPQYWFNTGPEDAEFIGESTEHKKYFYKNIIAGESYEYFNTKKKTWVKSGGYTANLFLAARRIVEETPDPEPKRWTAEDQKAGRLPDVGCIVIGCDKKEYEVLAQERCELALRNTSNRNLMLVTVSGFNRDFKPIETPEEKSKRLEDEFVDELMKDKDVYYTSSEQMAMCRKTARAAYRKLQKDTQ